MTRDARSASRPACRPVPTASIRSSCSCTERHSRAGTCMTTTDDELTGLHNRRSFLALLRRHVGFANERKTNLALIVVDIDGFARLNATYGYDFGDRALQYVAGQVREVTRAQDYAARIGD